MTESHGATQSAHTTVVKTNRTTSEFMESVLDDVIRERDRQDFKFGWIGTPGSLLPGTDEWRKLAVLGEEAGEVARAMLESSWGNDTQAHVEEELIQVAAVAVAWVEANRERRAMDAQRGAHGGTRH